MKGGTVVESIERVIAGHPFFAGIDQALLTQIVDSASHVKFDAGTYIFKEDDQANAFYLICDGRVGLEIVAPGHKPIIVDTLEGGDTLGWSPAVSVPLEIQRACEDRSTGHRTGCKISTSQVRREPQSGL